MFAGIFPARKSPWPQPIHRPLLPRHMPPQPSQQVHVRRTSPKEWNKKSLICVLALSRRKRISMTDFVIRCVWRRYLRFDNHRYTDADRRGPG